MLLDDVLVWLEFSRPINNSLDQNRSEFPYWVQVITLSLERGLKFELSIVEFPGYKAIAQQLSFSDIYMNYLTIIIIDKQL